MTCLVLMKNDEYLSAYKSVSRVDTSDELIFLFDDLGFGVTFDRLLCRIYLEMYATASLYDLSAHKLKGGPRMCVFEDQHECFWCFPEHIRLKDLNDNDDGDDDEQLPLCCMNGEGRDVVAMDGSWGVRCEAWGGAGKRVWGTDRMTLRMRGASLIDMLTLHTGDSNPLLDSRRCELVKTLGTAAEKFANERY